MDLFNESPTISLLRTPRHFLRLLGGVVFKEYNEYFLNKHIDWDNVGKEDLLEILKDSNTTAVRGTSLDWRKEKQSFRTP